MAKSVTHTFKAGSDKAVVEITSKYGAMTTWTITADEYSLQVHGEYTNSEGTVQEDGISLAPVDKNTVVFYI